MDDPDWGMQEVVSEMAVLRRLLPLVVPLLVGSVGGHVLVHGAHTPAPPLWLIWPVGLAVSAVAGWWWAGDE